MKWILASEQLPEVISTPYASGQNILWDKGSNRVFFRYKGESFAGRYVEEKLGIKNVFVTAEMDNIIPAVEFGNIEWLDESSPSPDQQEEMWEEAGKVMIGYTKVRSQLPNLLNKLKSKFHLTRKTD